MSFIDVIGEMNMKIIHKLNAERLLLRQYLFQKYPYDIADMITHFLPKAIDDYTIGCRDINQSHYIWTKFGLLSEIDAFEVGNDELYIYDFNKDIYDFMEDVEQMRKQNGYTPKN